MTLTERRNLDSLRGFGCESVPIFSTVSGAHVLIFGGTGFLGKHLCVLLHKKGIANVTVVSRNPDIEFLRQFAPSVRSVRLDHFMRFPQSVTWDGRNIVHLASTSTPGTYAQAPWQEFSNNVAPAFELFATLNRSFPSAKIIFISSGGTVYGSGHNRPIPESAALRPISSYGLGKVAEEQTLEFLNRTEGLKFEILRVSNPVGKWQVNPTQGVVNVMTRAVKAGQPIHLFGDGSYVRDFLDADDVGEAILKMSNRDQATNSAWNIGSGVATRIIDIVTQIERQFETKAVKEFFPARALDVHYSVLDCKKAAEGLDWRAGGDIAQMINRLAA